MASASRPMVRLERSLTRENLWLYILSILSRKRMHGYAINEEIVKRFGWKPGLITPYVVMYKLEEDKLIKSRSHGRRVLYEITPVGKNELKAAKVYITDISKKL